MNINWKRVTLYLLRVIDYFGCGWRCHDATLKHYILWELWLWLSCIAPQTVRAAHWEWRTLTAHRSLGWRDCGYYYVIPTDGAIECGQLEMLIGAHCKNHNSHSIGVAYVGGLTADGKTSCDTRIKAQKSALELLLSELHKRYPKALIVGNSDLDPHKLCCPIFDVVSEYRKLL